MPEHQSEEWFLETEKRFLEIIIVLVRYGGVGISYSPKSGVKRHMYLQGHIEHYDRDDRFEGKPVLIRLATPVDPEWEEKIKTEAEVDSACGRLSVRANVEATKVEQEFGTPPIQAFITISPDAFDAVSTHATETLDRIHRVRATIRLVGKSLPESGTGSMDAPIRLTDLDVSKDKGYGEDKGYAVGGFEISSTRTLYPRNRVLPIGRRWDERGGAGLSILLADAAYQLVVPTGRVYSVRCNGSVINANGKSYEGAGATVSFEEFHMQVLGLPLDSDPADELPERALFGQFSYTPKYKYKNKEYVSDRPFSFDLKHMPEDTRGLIIPILSQVAGAQVILTVYLTNEEEELLAGTDELKGSVRDYSFEVFEVRSRLTNGSP